MKRQMEFSYRRLLLQNEDVPISTSMPPLPHDAKHATNASSPPLSIGSPLQVSIRPVFTSSVAYVFLILFTTFFFIGFVFLYFQQHSSGSESESGGSRQREESSESSAAKTVAVVAEEARQGECSICLEEVGAGEAVKMIPYCRHVFHADCIDRWLEKQVTCPVCRCCCERCGEVESVRGEGEDGEVVSVTNLD